MSAALDVSQSFEREAARVLAEIEAISDENGTRYAGLMFDARPPWEAPWLVALALLVRREDSLAPSISRHVLPVYDGDRPADLSDHEIAEAWTWEPEYRLALRDSIGRVLVWREWIYDRGRGDGHASGVRETHREVHEALAGESTCGCKWCDEAAR